MAVNHSKIVKAGKDHDHDHKDYEEAMQHRDGFHDALVEHEYRRGHVMHDETPGADHKPVLTHEHHYRHIDGNKTCKLSQTLHGRDGHGKTALKFHTNELKPHRNALSER
jgi:hypothetical protein